MTVKDVNLLTSWKLCAAMHLELTAVEIEPVIALIFSELHKNSVNQFQNPGRSSTYSGNRRL